MNNLLFGLGCVSFVILFGLLFYYIYIKDVGDYSYKSLACITGMLILELLFFRFKNIFNIEGIKWISICFTFVLVLSILMYIRDSMNVSMYGAKLRHLITSISLILALAALTLFLKKNEMVEIAESNYEGNIAIIVSIACSLVVLFLSLYYRKMQLLKSELRNAQRYLRYNHFENNLLKNDFSKSDLLKIEKAIFRLYIMSQDEIPSTLDALRTLKRAKISSDFLHVMMERLYSEELLKRCSVLTLIEFQQELLPEIFTTRRAYRSSSMDMRYYEDFIERMRFSWKNDNKTLDEVSQKIDSLYQYIEKNLSPDSNDSGFAETYGCQNQIRELFHALETPIATSEMAISNLVVSFESLNDMQRDKFSKIQNNIKLIKSILFAYRELTFMNIYSSENTFFSLPVIIDSMKDILSCGADDSIVLEQQGIPDSVPQYSTNLIVVLIMPLIHNAIEASPCKKNVVVNYTQTEIGYTIKIENYCKQLPKQINLDTDGYSSKGNNHVGTGISIVRRISKSVNVDFHLKVNKNKVIAQLVFPKQ